MNLFDLTGKVALVTGAARGLGRGMALGLAEAGADIVVLDREDVSETVHAITQVGRPEKADAIVAETVAIAGRIDTLVNNAGIIRRAPLLEFTEKDWQEVIDLDLSSAFYLAQAAAKHWVQHNQRGKIVQIASLLSFQGGLLVPSYTAAKSGIAGITRAMANELAPRGINVNAIAPGYFSTEVTAGIRANPDRNRAILNRIPAERWGDPDDLKGAVIFLASPASDYVHGTVLAVDGGWLTR
ncbi:MAG: SDR family oxidoreductase [Armatimonadetes bacterium]|nr:SDR family oxidoreductase [Armatimonadota bacterium]